MSGGRPGHFPPSRNLGVPLVEHTRTAQGADGVPWLTDVWSLCPLPQTGSFKSGRQVSAVGLSPSPEVTPASDVSQLAAQDSQRFAGFAPDTWWPPDLQNVSQGRCGREGGGEGAALGRELQTARRCKWCTAASHSALHGTFPKHHFALLSNAFSSLSARISAAPLSANGSTPPPVWSQT